MKCTKIYEVEVKCRLGKISYEVQKTLKGAQSFGKKIANEAFYGEEAEVSVKEVAQ